MQRLEELNQRIRHHGLRVAKISHGTGASSEYRVMYDDPQTGERRLATCYGIATAENACRFLVIGITLKRNTTRA